MKTFVIGTKNPAKLNAVQKAIDNIQWIASLQSKDVPSGVSAQPRTDEETIQGAINRATQCQSSEHNIGIGLEGGVVETERGMFLCNWGALVSSNADPIIAGGARILIPEHVASDIRLGAELGPVMDTYLKTTGIRSKEGAIGVFTNNRCTRSDVFENIMRQLIGQFEYKQL